MVDKKRKHIDEPEAHPPTPVDSVKDRKKRQRVKELMEGRASLDNDIKTLEVEKRSMTDELTALLDELGMDRVQHGQIRATLYTTTRRKLDPVKLLQKGVSSQVIDACTDMSTSVSLRVSVIDEQAEESGE